jgi:hypothetical protein
MLSAIAARKAAANVALQQLNPTVEPALVEPSAPAPPPKRVPPKKKQVSKKRKRGTEHSVPNSEQNIKTVAKDAAINIGSVSLDDTPVAGPSTLPRQKSYSPSRPMREGGSEDLDVDMEYFSEHENTAPRYVA